MNKYYCDGKNESNSWDGAFLMGGGETIVKAETEQNAAEYYFSAYPTATVVKISMLGAEAEYRAGVVKVS